MKTALVVASCALLVACSGKTEDSGAQPAPETTEAPPPQQPEAPVEAPEPEPEPAAAAPALDCGALLTAADLEEACGLAAGAYEVKQGDMETGKGATACIRKVVATGKAFPEMSLAVNAGPGDAAGARALLDLDRDAEGASEVAVGDAGLLIEKDLEMPKKRIRDLEAVKGRLWFKISTTASGGPMKVASCSPEGLTELGKRIASRLPAE